jgi:cytochrome c
MRLLPLAGLAAMIGAFAAPSWAADAQSASADKVAFNNHCRTCHSDKPGDNRQGPSLGGIVGAKAGSQPGFQNYSQAMKSSGITWDEQTLDKFIANPESVVPNNNMKPFAGGPDPAVRRKIIASLKANDTKG